jgi:hypothetical protein
MAVIPEWAGANTSGMVTDTNIFLTHGTKYVVSFHATANGFLE